MRIAILGGGGVGVCAALELAHCGHAVDIYEQDSMPIKRASLVNEGKIHQGFLYANDPSRRTARLMALGALSFRACLSRWLDVTAHPFDASTPFVYAVHKDTMINVENLQHHYAACCEIFQQLRNASGLRYLGRDEPMSFRRLSPSELESILDPIHFAAAFITSELSIDPRPLAQQLRAAVSGEPRITFIGDAFVESVERRKNGGYFVAFSNKGSQQAGPYDQVVNALWDGRLAIDRTLGIIPKRSWIYRHKFGNRINVRLGPGDLPSVTMVLGPFGDVVNFGPKGIYLSWYPFGMVKTSFELQPPANWTLVDNATRYEIFDRSFKIWSRFCPKLLAINFRRDLVEPSSGIIFAWGDTNIDDPNSKLHDRYDIGVHSVAGYHSVNTGKYTMVPYLGLKVAQRVLGKESAPGLIETLER